MNDKDKEAFVKYMAENLPYSYYVSYHCPELKTWQAACEYKDKEQYIEGSIHESGGIKREMTWKESSDMMENMYQGAIARLDREYKRIRELQAENKEWKEAARSEANIVNELQAENKKLKEALEHESNKRKILQDGMEFIVSGRYYTEHVAEETLEKLKEVEKK
jgi:hypothetical protein